MRDFPHDCRIVDTYAYVRKFNFLVYLSDEPTAFSQYAGACPESDQADLLFLGTSFNNVGKGGVSAHNIIGKP